MTPEAYGQIPALQEQTSLNPTERFILTRGADDPMGQALDLIVPIGKGQRGLIVSPPKSGKTTILKHMANAIIENHPDTSVFVMLVDERPEEVTDFKRGIKAGYVLHSSADAKRRPAYAHCPADHEYGHTPNRNRPGCGRLH